ncbi:LytR/AlgR family response regulator transcription factor [Sphingobacterium thalpophilum]|uniref:LytR/AlgR family response regulator transcription factor n=1 Tax=Sphingobacterium thalpophilum TaxID=259 RepID=UPI003D99AA11
MKRIWAGVIIDDQQSSIDDLLALMEDIGYVHILKTFNDPKEAKTYLRVNQVDFMILDVELGRTNGFDFLRTLPKTNLKTILYTAHEQYEDPGYDIGLVDVLLKPVSKSRLCGALRRLDDELSRLLPVSANDSLEDYSYYFMIRMGFRYVRVAVWMKNIVYIESANGAIIFHMINGERLKSNNTMRQVLEVVPVRWFQQIHQSFVINISFFYSYEKGEVRMTLTDKRLPTGDKKIYKDFFEFINSNVLGD